MKPKLICLYGETCAGKSTLGKNISKRLGYRYISFGDLKRDEIKRHTHLGSQIQFLLDRECPIPAELGYDVIKGVIKNGIPNIISGYPISIDEFRTMSRNALVAGVIMLYVDEPTLIMRLGTRRECPVCHLPGSIGDVCPEHNVNMIQRDDVGINNPGAEPQGMAGALRAQPFPENRGFSDFPTRSPAAEPRGKGFAN